MGIQRESRGKECSHKFTVGAGLKGHVMHKFGMINWRSKNQEKVNNCRARLLEKRSWSNSTKVSEK